MRHKKCTKTRKPLIFLYARVFLSLLCLPVSPSGRLQNHRLTIERSVRNSHQTAQIVLATAQNLHNQTASRSHKGKRTTAGKYRKRRRPQIARKPPPGGFLIPSPPAASLAPPLASPSSGRSAARAATGRRSAAAPGRQPAATPTSLAGVR